MALHQLSRTGTAERPFYIRSTGIRIWSVEELCYYLSQNLALIDEEIAGPRLTRWLTEEFHLTSLSLAMEKGLRKENGLMDYLIPLFRDTGYYDTRELKKFSEALKTLEAAPAAERSLMKADALTRNRLYGEAEQYYRRAMLQTDPGDEELRARIAHNCGVAAAGLMEYDEALRQFRNALEIRDSRSNRAACLAVLRLTVPAEKFREEAKALDADENLIREVDEAIYKAMEVRYGEPEDLKRTVDELREEYHRESGS